MKSSTLLVRTNPPSNTIEGGIFQTEPESEPPKRGFLDVFGSQADIVMDAKSNFPYRLAQLSDVNGDLSKRWRIIFYVWNARTGKLVRRFKWIPSAFKTRAARLSEANRLIKAINKLLVEGYHISDGPAPSLPKEVFWSWKVAFDWVYQHREGSIRKRSVQTLELIRTELGKFLSIKGWLMLPVSRVTHDHCDQFMQYLKATRPIGNATYNNYLGFLKVNFNYLVKAQKLLVSPAANLGPLPTEEPEVVGFPPAVKAQLLTTFQEQCPELLILAQYIYYSFIRPGELRKLQIRHLQDKTVFVPGSISKTKKSQHVLISPAFERLLAKNKIRSYPAHYFLVSHDGLPGTKPTSPNYFTSRHLHIRRELRLPAEYTLYCWKHTGVTDTYLQTKDIEFVSRQCRHSSLDMTKRYLRGLGLLQEYPGMAALPDLGL